MTMNILPFIVHSWLHYKAHQDRAEIVQSLCSTLKVYKVLGLIAGVPVISNAVTALQPLWKKSASQDAVGLIPGPGELESHPLTYETVFKTTESLTENLKRVGESSATLAVAARFAETVLPAIFLIQLIGQAILVYIAVLIPVNLLYFKWKLRNHPDTEKMKTPVVFTVSAFPDRIAVYLPYWPFRPSYAIRIPLNRWTLVPLLLVSLVLFLGFETVVVGIFAWWHDVSLISLQLALANLAIKENGGEFLLKGLTTGPELISAAQRAGQAAKATRWIGTAAAVVGSAFRFLRGGSGTPPPNSPTRKSEELLTSIPAQNTRPPEGDLIRMTPTPEASTSKPVFGSPSDWQTRPEVDSNNSTASSEIQRVIAEIINDDPPAP